MKKYEEMSKEELLELVKKGSNGKNRGNEVLRLMREGFDSIEAIGEELGINAKNVSSIFSGLRKKGHVIINVRAGGSSVCMLLESDDDKRRFGLFEGEVK